MLTYKGHEIKKPLFYKGFALMRFTGKNVPALKGFLVIARKYNGTDNYYLYTAEKAFFMLRNSYRTYNLPREIGGGYGIMEDHILAAAEDLEFMEDVAQIRTAINFPRSVYTDFLAELEAEYGK